MPKEREIQRSTWFCSQMMCTNEGAEARVRRVALRAVNALTTMFISITSPLHSAGDQSCDFFLCSRAPKQDWGKIYLSTLLWTFKLSEHSVTSWPWMMLNITVRTFRTVSLLERTFSSLWRLELSILQPQQVQTEAELIQRCWKSHNTVLTHESRTQWKRTQSRKETQWQENWNQIFSISLMIKYILLTWRSEIFFLAFAVTFQQFQEDFL